MKRLIFLALVLASSLSSLANAQTTIQYISRHAVHDVVPMQCRMAGAELIKDLNEFPHPAQWTYVIVCDDSGWMSLMHDSLNTQAKYIYGSTLRTVRTTLFRGQTLLGNSPTVTPEHVVAHELAHVYLNSSDEVAVENQALKWLAARQPTQLAAK